MGASVFGHWGIGALAALGHWGIGALAVIGHRGIGGLPAALGHWALAVLGRWGIGALANWGMGALHPPGLRVGPIVDEFYLVVGHLVRVSVRVRVRVRDRVRVKTRSRASTRGFEVGVRVSSSSLTHAMSSSALCELSRCALAAAWA